MRAFYPRCVIFGQGQLVTALSTTTCKNLFLLKFWGVERNQLFRNFSSKLVRKRDWVKISNSIQITILIKRSTPHKGDRCFRVSAACVIIGNWFTGKFVLEWGWKFILEWGLIIIGLDCFIALFNNSKQYKIDELRWIVRFYCMRKTWNGFLWSAQFNQFTQFLWENFNEQAISSKLDNFSGAFLSSCLSTDIGCVSIYTHIWLKLSVIILASVSWFLLYFPHEKKQHSENQSI